MEDRRMNYMQRLWIEAEYIFYSLGLHYEVMLYEARHGCTPAMVSDIVMTLLVIRFVIDLLTKNIKTAIIILCICGSTVYIWNRYLYSTIMILKDNWEFAPYFEPFRWKAKNFKFLVKGLKYKYIRRENLMIVDWRNPHMIFFYTMRRMLNRFSQDGRDFRVDPISMWVSAQKLPNNHKLVFRYYKWYNIYIPSFTKAAKTIWVQVRSFSQFTILTRVGKAYIPYFFRWHFTFLLIYENTAKIFLEMAVRSIWFWQEVCWNGAAQYLWFHIADELQIDYETFEEIYEIDRTAKNRITNVPIHDTFYKTTEDLYTSWNNARIGNYKLPVILNAACNARAAQILNEVIIYVHMFVLLSGMFNGALGQYMYIPFIVENVERHVEYNPKKMDYSTGYAAWQAIPLSVRAKRFPPQLWWGWFSRGTDKGNIFLYIPKQIFKFILRKLRNFLRKLKRKI